jgi:hypothetical protein
MEKEASEGVMKGAVEGGAVGIGTLNPRTKLLRIARCRKTT